MERLYEYLQEIDLKNCLETELASEVDSPSLTVKLPIIKAALYQDNGFVVFQDIVLEENGVYRQMGKLLHT